MKFTTISLALIAAALLPSLANATGTETMSSTRGSHCNLATATVTIVATDKKPDPMEQKVEAAVDSTADPVLASYYRDLYRASPSYATETFVRTPDPYVDAISMALYGSVEPDSQRVC